LLAPPTVKADDLVLNAGGKSTRLGVTVTIEGQSPAKAHDAFLDKLFNFFDRDGDGYLSAEEAARVIPLPLPGAHELIIDFKKLDRDGDGKGSRDEFKRFCREAGFMAVAANVQAGNPESIAAGELLFNQLDRDGDGRLSKAELERAPLLLKRFDADEDEVITVAEILSVIDSGKIRKSEVSIGWEPAGKIDPDGTLSLDLGPPGKLQFTLKSTGTIFELLDARTFRFGGGDGVIRVGGNESDLSVRLRSTREFYLAPFRSALGDKQALERKQIQDEPLLAYLSGFVNYADRNGDGSLTLAELEKFLDLIEDGVRSQILVTIVDRGRNFFDLLDENRDGLIDRRELNHAVQLIADGEEFLLRSKIPEQIDLRVERSSSKPSFGPVLLAASQKRPAAAKQSPARGPKWFQAMDRNGDGFVSPDEFPGSPEAFAALDSDHDGFISAEEAERANAPPRKGQTRVRELKNP